MTSPTPAADLPSLAVTFVTSAARSLLQLAAGALVAHGVLASGQSADFVQVGVGLAVGVAALAWSWIEKQHNHAQAIAVVKAAGS